METNYEISRVADFIRTHNFTTVALQFPDELLKDSMSVVKSLRSEVDSSVKVYVMADTTYGSCCVDEVGAAHVNAQCVVHYGHTCLSQTSTLPALFIFGKASINTANCTRKLLEHGLKSRKPILVLFGVEYAHAIQNIKEMLTQTSSNIYESATTSEPLFANVRFSVINPTEKSRPEDQPGPVDTNVFDISFAKGTDNVYNVGGLSWQLPEGHKMEDYLLFWIGMDNTAFANVVLIFNSCEIVRYDATEDCMMTDLSQQRKILKRRYYLVEKAKDANMIGILVGTLGAVGYLDIIHQLKELISRAGKKSYTFVMGRPNPAKLANFPECDVFINVSCAETALLDSKEFLAPVITPFEAMLALDRGSQWTGEYLMEFRDLITSTPSVERVHTEEARFSFLQGGYVEDLGAEDDPEEDKDEVQSLVNVTAKALQVRDQDSRSITKSIPKSGAEYFAGRSHHGLEIIGDSLPEKFLVGRSGKASGYKDEKTARLIISRQLLKPER